MLLPGLRAKNFCSFFFITFSGIVRAEQKGSLARCRSKSKKSFDKNKNKTQKICPLSSERAKKSHFRPLARTSPAPFAQKRSGVMAIWSAEIRFSKDKNEFCCLKKFFSCLENASSTKTAHLSPLTLSRQNTTSYLPTK